MALKPAPMDQCQLKCLAATGINQGQAYDCAQPCEDGQGFVEDVYDCSGPCNAGCSRSMTLKAYMTFTPNSAELARQVNTFVPVTVKSEGVAPPTKVIDDEAFVWDPCAGDWEMVTAVPYKDGDEYLGDTIRDVVYEVSFASGGC